MFILGEQHTTHDWLTCNSVEVVEFLLRLDSRRLSAYCGALFQSVPHHSAWSVSASKVELVPIVHEIIRDRLPIWTLLQWYSYHY